MIAVNLGDSAIELIRSDKKMIKVLNPKVFSGQPCLVTTDSAWKVMDVKKFGLQRGTTLFMCTDGFWKNVNTDARINDNLERCKFKNLNQLLDSFKFTDDCGYIAVSLDDYEDNNLVMAEVKGGRK